MYKLLNQLIQDECGALLSIEMVLVATIVLLGTIAGLTSLRDSVVQEFGDVSAGLAELDHGYEFNDIFESNAIENMRYSFSISGSNYNDLPNFCEPANVDPTNAPPMCMLFSSAFVVDENQPVANPVP